jgi:hypothetical protein
VIADALCEKSPLVPVIEATVIVAVGMSEVFIWSCVTVHSPSGALVTHEVVPLPPGSHEVVTVAPSTGAPFSLRAVTVTVIDHLDPRVEAEAASDVFTEDGVVVVVSPALAWVVGVLVAVEGLVGAASPRSGAPAPERSASSCEAPMRMRSTPTTRASATRPSTRAYSAAVAPRSRFTG